MNSVQLRDQILLYLPANNVGFSNEWRQKTADGIMTEIKNHVDYVIGPDEKTEEVVASYGQKRPIPGATIRNTERAEQRNRAGAY